MFRWAILSAALILLDVSLTFANVWPTLGIWWSGELSAELAVCILGLVAAGRWLGVPSRLARRWLAIVWVLLVIGRYAEVTSKSLYGRDINLYWDLRLMPDVTAMFAFVAKPWIVVGVLAAVILIPLLIYAPVRWALGRVSDAATDPRERRILGLVAAGVLAISVAGTLDAERLPYPRIAQPVTAALAKQAGQVVYEMRGGSGISLPPALPIRSDFSRVDGADVLLIFLESYGVVSWEQPAFVKGLTQSRARLDADIHDTGREVVTGLVTSTTFGGESWLAHISLLSGTAVRDQDTNVRLLAQQRDTLPKAFTRHGYRSVLIMPGLQHGWPEGAFYGFDDIYGTAKLDYHGPPFGWWDLSDQYALARMDALEVAHQPRKPVFVVFPTISTHAPFTPAPPYQPDWKRMLTKNPYDQVDLKRAWGQQPDWSNLAPSFIEAFNYAYATLGGYLRFRADRDLVMIVIGDHQPPALVSGAGATWDVPVHVIASRRALLDRLMQHGFQEGLDPPQSPIAQMDTVQKILLDAFGDEEAAPAMKAN